jgi:hypothetical protein
MSAVPYMSGFLFRFVVFLWLMVAPHPVERHSKSAVGYVIEVLIGVQGAKIFNLLPVWI